MLNLSRHRWLRCTLCILLAVVLAFMPTVKAYAVAITATTATILVVGTILTAFGITFASSDALQRGALSFYNSLTGTARTFIHESVNSYQTAGPGGKWIMTLGVGMALMFSKLIADFFPKNQTDKEDTSAGAVGEDGTVLNPPNAADYWQKYVGKTVSQFVRSVPDNPRDRISLPIPIVISQPLAPDRIPADCVFVPFVLREPVISHFTYNATSGPGWAWYPTCDSPAFVTDNKDAVYRFYDQFGATIDYQLRLSLFQKASSSADTFVYLELLESKAGADLTVKTRLPIQGEYAYFERGYFPYAFGFQLSISDEGGFSFGSFFKSIDANNQNSSLDTVVSGNRYNRYTFASSVGGQCILGVPVDRKTGEGIGDDVLPVPYIPDAGISANPAVNDVLQKELDKDKDAGISVGVPAVPDDLVGRTWPDVWTESQIKDLIKDAIEESTTNPPDPGGGGDSGGGSFPPPAFVPIDMLFKAFPFCIPLDLAMILGALVAEPVAPRFVVPFKVGDIVNSEIVLDLTEWESVVKIIREGEYILFLVGLALLTFTAKKV